MNTARSGFEMPASEALKGVQVAVQLFSGLNPDEGGAHLVYFETGSGGAVFSAGSITYPTGLLCDPPTSAITANVMERFLERT